MSRQPGNVGGEAGDFSQTSPQMSSPPVQQSPLQQYLMSGGQTLRPGYSQDSSLLVTPVYQSPVQLGSMSPQAMGGMYPTSPGYNSSGGYPQGIAAQSPAVVSQLQRQLSNPVMTGLYGQQVYAESTQPPPPAYPSNPVLSTGSTIHHHGQSPSRGQPLVNPTQSLQPHMSTPQRRPSGGSNMASRPPQLPTSSTGYIPTNPVAPSPKKSERPRKRQRIEEKPAANEKIARFRKLICDAKLKQVADLKENYIDNLTELYFLQLGLNLVDFYTWKKRPTPQLVAFLQSGKLDSDEEETRPHEKRINDEVKVLTSSLGSNKPLTTPVAISTSLPASVSQLQQGTSGTQGGRHGMLFSHVSSGGSAAQPPAYGVASSNKLITVKTEPSELKTSTPTLAAALSSSSGMKGPSPKTPLSPGSLQRLHTRQHSISALYDNTVGSQEAIMERAKQEAQVMQKVAELRKQGLWSSRRLPKVQEPPRQKAHWDYLLEEMQWLAADFAQERKWKKAGCRKIARMITRYHQEQAEKVKKAEKEEANKLKRTASAMAKMVKEFWQQIEKVVQYKQQSRLDEKRKKALDLHLNFIVDQTEKYSTWLTEGLSKSQAPSVASSSSLLIEDDNDFEPEVSDASDDEETIQKEEEEAGLSEEHTRLELEALQKESEIPLEDLIQSLPPEILGETGDDLDKLTEEDNAEDGDDAEFEEGGEEAVDDEMTLDEQEDHEQNDDHNDELGDLAKEGELPIEELMKKYSGAYESDFEMESQDSEESESEEDEETEEPVEESVTEESGSEEEQDGLEDVGMEYLIHPEKEEPIPKAPQVEGPGKEITDIAATAQSLQPTGYTLETTAVKTAVPFLLKHTLREYQHVGLDWLATLNDRKLNGILADEMGLGKTIQTIALLAHLACHHGVWGPHLIVVPTSVMLNWEMEIKKWCPAFKILTYYGSQKERKQKRTGWTKTNAFHVCITSYKLVIQDHQSFRRKKWKYLVLDEAQNIKNFKSQRWQTLLNFSSQRRLLLTGTPLQNSLMELWSLMHFLMPHVFQSHREFKEWFANPLSGMIEGSQEYNENLIKRLHKVLRPFLLRRLKQDVEKQMPKKYEHVVMCRLSKRQRFLYDDFMSQTKTKETLASGHFMSVINILMQLRKVCNHPNLFDPRPIISPFQAEGITYSTASLVLRALDKNPLEYINPEDFHPNLCDMELSLPAFAAHRVKKLATPKPLIEEIDNHPEPPERPRPVNMKNYFYKLSAQSAQQPSSGRQSPFVPIQQRAASPLAKTPVVRSPANSASPSPTLLRQVVSQQQSILMPVSLQTTQVHQLPGYTARPTLVQRTIPGQQIARSSPLTIPRATLTQHGVIMGSSSPSSSAQSQPITVQIQHTQQGTRLMIPSGQISQLPGLIQIVQTSSGQQIITAAPQLTASNVIQTSGTQLHTSGTQPSVATTIAPSAISGTIQSTTAPVVVTNIPSTTVVQAVAPMQKTVAYPVVAQPTTAAPSVQSISAGSEIVRTVVSHGTPVASNVVTAAGPSSTLANSTVSLTVTSVVPTTAVSGALSTLVTAINGKPSAVVKPAQQTTGALTTSTVLPVTTPTVSTLPSMDSSTNVMRPVVRVSPMTTQAIANATTGASLSTVTTSSMTAVASTTGAQQPKMSTRSLSAKEQRLARFRQELKIETIEETKKQNRKDKLHRLSSVNKKRCTFKPVYGQDMCASVNIINNETFNQQNNNNVWEGKGYQHCKLAVGTDRLWHSTGALKDIVRTPLQCMQQLHDVISRFVFVTPPATAPQIRLHTSHPPPDFTLREVRLQQALHHDLSPKAVCLHPIKTRMAVQFPEVRLIQYDCGKLQTLDLLLRRLKTGDHRVLIFTQMTRMLDVLEQFLSYHGHRYLRLDGTTKVEQRQILMDRFNMDKRIFVFILSTRSGGIGVNLTGADTVIFYDSDWNPTMDAQAQDRCHRIGQTRDVHIYRLISEKTVEENILKKANQKRLLGNVAIEGGNFTTAFFKQNTLNELFNEPSGLDSLVEKEDREEKPVVVETKPSTKPEVYESQLEQALGAAEDETDVQAAKGAKAEQKAELAEFDEEIPWDEKEAEKKREDDESKVEKELALLEQELRAVERYAVGFVESQLAPFNLEELKIAEEEVATAKQDWELSRLKALKEEEERRAEIEEDEMLFTYTREDAYNQVYICDVTGENMPLWAPPTPPQDDHDVYIDQTMCFLYEPSAMAESQLPPVYVKREHKRIRLDSSASRHHKLKQRRDDHPRVPRSLFDRPNSQIIKMRREAKLHKLKFGSRPHMPLSTRSPTGPIVNKMVDSGGDHPEWLIHEDWALLQAIQTLLELPLNLIVINPAHIPNWDLVANVVNATSRIYRSPKMCRNRYENVIIPREEGKILYDINPRKQKKSKGIYKTLLNSQTKNNRAMRTSQLFAQDNHGSDNTLHAFKLDAIKSASAKRTPTLRPTLVNPSLKNPKHAAVLADSGINYEQPSTPVQVAAIRAERIEREKKAQQTQAAAAAEQTLATQCVQQATVTLASQTITQVRPQTATSTVQIQQLQPITTTAASTVMQTSTLQKSVGGAGVSAVSISRQLAGTSSIVVNTAGGISNTFATINKRMNQQSGTPTVVSGVVTQTSRSPRSTPVSMQEITAVVQAQARSLATTQVAVTTTLTAAQLQTAQRLASVNTVATTVPGMLTVNKGTVQQQVTTKQLTPQQLQYLKQQQIIKRQLLAQQQRQQGQVGQAVQGQQQLLRLQVPHQLTQGTVGGQKLSVTGTQLVTQQGATLQGQRLQVKPQLTQKVSTRPMTEAEIQALMKQRALQQQQQKAAQAAGLTTTTQLSQPQHVSRILSQAKLQQAGLPVSTHGGVATLVKTVSSSALPVTAVSVGGVNISMQQQKVTTTGGVRTATVAGQQPQQLSVRQIQALHQRRLLTTTQGRVASLNQAQLKSQLGNAVQIITQPAKSTSIPMAQIQQFINKQQSSAAAQGQSMPQIITSISHAQQAAATSAMTTTQLPSHPVAHIVTKVSQPASTVARTPSISIAIPSSTPNVAATVVTSGISVITTAAAISASSTMKPSLVTTQLPTTVVQQAAAVIQQQPQQQMTTVSVKPAVQQVSQQIAQQQQQQQPPATSQQQQQQQPAASVPIVVEEDKAQEDTDTTGGQKSTPYAMRLRKH